MRLRSRFSGSEDQAVDVLEALRRERERLHRRILLDGVVADLALCGGEHRSPVDLALTDRRLPLGGQAEVDDILDVERLDAVPEPLDQRRGVLAGDRGPADVELEGHPARVGVLEQDLPGALERSVALDVDVLRLELGGVVVPEDRSGAVLDRALAQPVSVAAVARTFS